MTATVAPRVAADVGAALAARLGAAADTTDGARRAWAVAGVVPAAVACPASPEEVAATVAVAAEVGAALVPLGRGAHRDLGHPPSRYDLALVTERMTRVLDYTPADMTVTVEAGTTLANLAALLARHGQWLPLDVACPDVTTVGGLLAADLAGPLAASEGRPRDFLIGMRVVTAGGTPARAGGRVVKNVAGYDVMKLFVGSLGTLAVLTEATFKVRPLPERQHGLVLTTRDMQAALALGGALDGALAVTASGALGGDGSHARVAVRLGGSAADVEAAHDRVVATAARHGGEVERDADAADPALRGRFDALRDFGAFAAGDLVVRFATLPSRLVAAAEAVLDGLAGASGSWVADPRRGVMTFAIMTATPADALATLARVADAHGARFVVERFPAALAATIAVWHPLPAALPLMRRMKAALDPAGTLAPGRHVGRI